MVRKRSNNSLHLAGTSVCQKKSGISKGHPQDCKGLKDLDNITKLSEKYFEITPSLIFEDVPENEILLEALVSDVVSRDEQLYADKNNPVNAEPILTINSDIVDCCKHDRIQKTYSQKHSLKILNHKYNELKTFHFDGKNKVKSPKEKISCVDNFQLVKGSGKNYAISNSGKFNNSNQANISKTKSPNKTSNKTNTAHSDANNCHNLMKETLPSIVAHSSKSKVLSPDESKNTLEINECGTYKLSKYSGKNSNFSKQNVYIVKLSKNSNSEGKMVTNLIKSDVDVKSKDVSSSCSSTIPASNENQIQGPRTYNSCNDSNKSSKCSLNKQIKNNRTQSVLNHDELHISENLHPVVFLTDYRKEYKKQMKDKNLLKENIILADANVAICENYDVKNENMDDSFQGSPKLKQIRRVKTMQTETNDIKEELIMGNGMNSSVIPVRSPVKNIVEFHKEQVISSENLSKNLISLTQNQTTGNETRVLLKSVTTNVEEENKTSCFQLPSIASKEEEMEKCRKVEKVKNCLSSKNVEKQNSTPVKAKRDEIPTGASNRKRLSLMDMFKIYSEKITQPSESEAFIDDQSSMQCDLGKSNKEVKEGNSSENIDVLPIAKRLSRSINNNCNNKCKSKMSSDSTSKSACKNPSSYRKRQSETSSVNRTVRCCVAKRRCIANIGNKATGKKYIKGRPKKQVQEKCSFVAKNRNMQSTTKMKSMTISNLLARLSAKKSSNSTITVSNFSSFKRKVEADTLTSSDRKLFFKMETSHLKNSLLNVNEEANVTNNVNHAKNSSIDSNSESSLPTKRRNASISVQSKILDDNFDECKKCNKKKFEQKSAFNTQLKGTIFIGRELPTSDVSNHVHNTSQDKCHTLNECSIRYGSEVGDNIGHQSTGKLSVEAMKFISGNTLKESNCESCLNQQRDMTNERKSKKNGQISQMKTCKDSSHTCGAQEKTNGLMGYQGEDSLFTSETLENMNKTEFVSGSDWIKDEEDDNPPVQVKKKLKNSNAVPRNQNNFPPMGIQTPNNSVFYPVNNSLLYSNPTVPQINNLSAYPYANQFVVQPQNVFQVQNPYGVIVPFHNPFQSSITVPLYQAGPVLQTPYLQGNNFSLQSATFQNELDPLELNQMQSGSQTRDNSSKDVDGPCSEDYADQNSTKNISMVVCDLHSSDILGKAANKSGKMHSCNCTNKKCFHELKKKLIRKLKRNVKTEVSSTYSDFPNGMMVNENSVISIPSTIILSGKSGRKIPIPILSNSSKITEKITIEREVKKMQIVHLDHEQNIIMQKLKESCFNVLYDSICEFFSSCENLKLSVRKFYSQPFVKAAFSNKLCEMITDSEPEVKYIFNDHFLETPIREVMKDYVNFFLSILYTKPDFKNYFVQRAFEKLSFRDSTYFCMSLPEENELIDETGLALHLSFAALFAIFDECRQQGL